MGFCSMFMWKYCITARCSLAPLDCVYVRVSDSNSHCELLLLTGGSVEYTAHSLCSSDALDLRSPEHFIIEKKFLIGI